MTKKIIVTGGEGRFAKILKKKNKKLNLIFLSKKQCNILNIRSNQHKKYMIKFLEDNRGYILFESIHYNRGFGSWQRD